MRLSKPWRRLTGLLVIPLNETTMGTRRHTKRDEEQLLLWSDLPSTSQAKKKPFNEPTSAKRAALRRLENIRLLIELRFDGDPDGLTGLLSESHARALHALLIRDESQYFPAQMAEQIEEVCSIQPGWLDITHDNADPLATKISALDERRRQVLDNVVNALLSSN